MLGGGLVAGQGHVVGAAWRGGGSVEWRGQPGPWPRPGPGPRPPVPGPALGHVQVSFRPAGRQRASLEARPSAGAGGVPRRSMRRVHLR